MRIFVRRNASEPVPDGFVGLEPGANLIDGSKSFSEHFGPPNSLEEDLLLIASAVFAADRLCSRGDREDFVRRIEISIPIINIGTLQPVINDIAALLRALSKDSWKVSFRQSPGTAFVAKDVKGSDKRVLLFSGGLDSFAAAFRFGTLKAPLVLVSHVTQNLPVKNAQKELASLLKKGGVHEEHYQFFVSSKDGFPAMGFDHDAENTQRTRSFLFMTLGALVGKRLGASEILMVAENGQMAIHLPLTQGRVSAFSTHTAHPDVLGRAERLFAKVLSPTIKITNPFVNETKAEVVKKLCQEFSHSIPLTISCWKNTKIPKEFSHCGFCIPCYIRRIALEFNGVDPTGYARDPWNEDIEALPPEDDARRNFADYAEFLKRFEGYSDGELMTEWPELAFSAINSKDAIAMYRRAAAESKAVFSKYPKLQGMLQ